MTDLPVMLRALADEGVAFILVGAAAAVAHGSARPRRALEVVYQRKRDNHARLVGALRPYAPRPCGATPGQPFRWDIDTLTRGRDFALTTSLGDIDLLADLAGEGSYEELEPHTIRMRAFDVECRCLDVGALIRVKRATGRPEDLEAARELEARLEERGGEGA